MNRRVAARTRNGDREPLEDCQRGVAVAASTLAPIRISLGEIDDAERLARVAASERAPKTLAAGFPPTHGELPAGEFAYGAAIFDDRSHDALLDAVKTAGALRSRS
jgi:hypothetical protein